MALAIARPAVREVLRAAMAAGLAALVACRGAEDDVLLVGTVERTLLELDPPVSATLLAAPLPRPGGRPGSRGRAPARRRPPPAAGPGARIARRRRRRPDRVRSRRARTRGGGGRGGGGAG